MGKIFYVYIYYDNNLIPFYVGIGHGNRITNHLRPSIYKSRPTLFYNKLSKMITSDTPFSYKKIKEDISLSQAKEIEEVLIKLIGRRDLKEGTLCNLTDGGEGHKGYIKSEELRKQISSWSSGKKLSKAHLKRLSEINTGKKHSKETREKISKTQKGTKKPKPASSIPNYRKAAQLRAQNKEHIKKLKLSQRHRNGVKVIQLTLKEEFIKAWDNQIDAAEYVRGRGDRILDVCRGKSNTHKNYKWKFYE